MEPLIDVTEQKRLNEAREARHPLEEVGAVPQRAAVGHRPRGLQPRRQRVGLLHPRPGAVARLPLGRGRPGRHLRRQAAAVLRAGAVERRDPILKERLFGLTNSEGNHGEDVKEYYFYLDSTPTHSYMKYLYKYPQAAYPVRATWSRRTGAARARSSSTSCSTPACSTTTATSTCSSSTRRRRRKTCSSASPCTTAGPKRRGCTCCRRCGSATHGPGATSRPEALAARGRRRASSRPRITSSASYALSCDGAPELLFTENETNAQRLWGQPNRTPYVKDAIHALRRHGRPRRGEPRQTGTKAAAHYVLDVAGRREPDASACGSRRDAGAAIAFGGLRRGLAERLADADEFYARITPERSTRTSAASTARRSPACCGEAVLLLRPRAVAEGAQAHPLIGVARAGVRNAEWFHMLNADIISMPDKWEYPWYAAWDLAFHTLALSLVDFDFAKEQLLLMLRSLYCHPNGQIPAYEWNFSDVNPPVHAWATLYLYKMERDAGPGDLRFLERSFQELMLNFNWWVNRKDPQGRNVFEGGFLGLDNIGVFDRSAPLPTGGSLEQADGTAWMAFYCQNMLEMALDPGRARPDVRGARLQVPPALHVDRLRDGPRRRAPRRDVGRGGRVLLRRAAAARRPGDAPEGAVDGRAAAALCGDGVRGRRRRAATRG